MRSSMVETLSVESVLWSEVTGSCDGMVETLSAESVLQPEATGSRDAMAKNGIMAIAKNNAAEKYCSMSEI